MSGPPSSASLSESTYNVNVGVLGHVDSGKTSLVAALSTTLSTAALDKHPQSKERGITLDLGFSSLTAPAPAHIAAAGYEQVQVTLVDCPGHASLIRTIIGGAQIVDSVLLVVDITKGIQTQTAECIVIAEVAARDMIVVLNKTDLIPEEKRDKYVRKAQKLVAQTLAATKFAGCPMVEVSAHPGTAPDSTAIPAQGVSQLVQTLLARTRVQPSNAAGGPFLFLIDHCFAIKGQGTVLTGTVARGGIRVNDTLELPELKQQRKVKSMQQFRRPVQSCQQRDRVGICVTQLDPKLVERGLACAPGSVHTVEAAVAAVEKIRFYSPEVKSRSKMHVTIGHATVMAELLFFGVPDGQGLPPEQALDSMMQRIGQLAVSSSPAEQQAQQGASGGGGAAGSSPAAVFDSSRDYLYQEGLYGVEGRPASSSSSSGGGGAGTTGSEQLQQAGVHYGPQWVYLRFSQPVTATPDSIVIGSKLDADLNGSACRLAFYGRLCRTLDPGDPQQLRSALRIYKQKQRQGVVERLEGGGCSAVCRGMFQKDTDISLFAGMHVRVTPGGQVGTIEGGFGKSGKFRVRFSEPLAAAEEERGGGPLRLELHFKRYLFDEGKRHMVQ